MNDKLIFRAATAYREMLIKIAQKNQALIDFPRHISQVKNLLHEISTWTQRLEITKANGWESATRFLKNNMINGLVRKITNNFAAMETELSEENEISVPSIKFLWQEIKSLNGLFEDSDFRNGRLSVTTKPIVLEHDGETLGLGRFKIIIDFKTDIAARSYEHMIYMEALEPNCSPGEDNLVHPHVRGNEPCLGEAVGLMQEPFVQGQIESVFLILNSMLKTYNPISPYRTMEEWYDEAHECSWCGNGLGEDEGYCCNDCGTSICDSCCWWCARCEEYYCESHSGFRCGWCEDTICGGCYHNECKVCVASLCESCIHGCCDTYCEDCSPVCEFCGDSFCLECEGVECTVCNNKHCENCITSCEECDAKTCDECGNECTTCNDPICPECTKHCNNCNQNYCKKCIDEEKCSLLKEKA